MAAPGDGIYAPFPQEGYAAWGGITMAAPFVAGQAALDAATPTFVGRLGSGQADAAASTAYAANQPNPCAGTGVE